MLAWLQQLLITYGYGAVALVVMGESLGLPLHGETLLLLGAAYAGAGYLEVWGIIVAAAVGAIVGDTLGYELGRWGGRALLERYGPVLHLKAQHLARAEAFFARYGAKTVFVGRFIAVLRTYSALLAGIYRLPYRRCLLFNAAGGLLWVLTFGWLGAAFGSQWPLIQRWARRAGLLMLGLLVLVGVVVRLGCWAIRREARAGRGGRSPAGVPDRVQSPLPRRALSARCPGRLCRWRGLAGVHDHRCGDSPAVPVGSCAYRHRAPEDEVLGPADRGMIT